MADNNKVNKNQSIKKLKKHSLRLLFLGSMLGIGWYGLENYDVQTLINSEESTSVEVVTPSSSFAASTQNSDNQDAGQVGQPHQVAFIEEILPAAKNAQKEYGLRPSVILAQAILESDWGTSQLAQDHYNFFGIKGSSSSPSFQTMEFDGEWQQIQDNFASYESIEHAVDSYATLLTQGTSWNPQQYEAVLEADSYQEAAEGLVSSGYATDPDYTQKVIRIIETYELDKYDV